MSELHGNRNLEMCKKCGSEYMRDFRVRNAQKEHSHATGRECDNPKCRGALHDSIINFGEGLNQKIQTQGFDESGKSDLCLAMGTSLRVTPAANMPASVSQKGHNLVICNLQKTPLDHLAALCIYAKCDDIMIPLMDKLGYQIPKWLKQVRVNLTLESDGKCGIICVDSNGAPYEMMKKFEVTANGKPSTSFPSSFQKIQPFKYTIPNEADSFSIKCTFHGNYKEPELTFTVEKSMLYQYQQVEVLMSYDVSIG